MGQPLLPPPHPVPILAPEYNHCENSKCGICTSGEQVLPPAGVWKTFCLLGCHHGQIVSNGAGRGSVRWGSSPLLRWVSQPRCGLCTLPLEPACQRGCGPTAPLPGHRRVLLTSSRVRLDELPFTQGSVTREQVSYSPRLQSSFVMQLGTKLGGETPSMASPWDLISWACSDLPLG